MHIVELEDHGQKWRFPKVLAGRYRPERVLSQGGFGLLVVARDERLFDRKVLIKTGFVENRELEVPNNLAIPDRVNKMKNRFTIERNCLLHGQMRGIDGIPVLIDSFLEKSPHIRGPHRSGGGETVYHKNPTYWESVPYLVLSYFDGVPLDTYCQKSANRQSKGSPPVIARNSKGFVRHLGIYLCNILQEFHKYKVVGETCLFVYQDLKPSNVLFSERQNRHCLIDFGGMAMCLKDGRVINPLVKTDGYAPPEADDVSLRLADRIRPVWDVYSLGKTLKECIRMAKIDDSFRGAWNELLAKCTAEAPKDRYQDMQEVVKALLKLN